MNRRFAPFGFSLSLALSSTLLVGVASADPTPAERATAEALFRDAKELEAQNHFDEACPKFVESYNLDPKPGALLNSAACHEKQGKLGSAWEEYREAIALSQKYNQPERREFAEKKMKEIEAKLSRVVITTVEAHAGLALEIDGRAMSAAVLDTPFPIDPGTHTLVAKVPGQKPITRAFYVDPEPGLLEIELPATDMPSVKPRPAAPVNTETPKKEPDRRGLAAPPLPSLILFGAALCGASAGTAFGITALNRKSDVDQNCSGSSCNAIGIDANNDAHTAANTSTVLFVIGGAAAIAGGVYWYLKPRARGAATSASAYIAPSVDAHSGGVLFGGTL